MPVRNLDVKDIPGGEGPHEDRKWYFLDYQLSTIVLFPVVRLVWVELSESCPVTEVFCWKAQPTNQGVLFDDDLVLPIENGEIDSMESVNR